jgi:cytosine/adenosine deaminase-related metal-dependent hydrolase
MIAMPGMVNAHCHSPANLVRGMMPSKPLEIWRAYYRASLRDMREDDFYASALLGGMEMLKNGATTVLDHFAGSAACRFMGAGAAIQAMRDLGLASRRGAHGDRQELRRHDPARSYRRDSERLRSSA